MSDGSSSIRVIDARGFREVARLTVREGDRPVWMLNELEVVGGELWANVYQTDLIARIDIATGRVIGWVDVGALLTATERAGVTRRGGVANGIAYDAAHGTVLVTGKLWPRLFELGLAELSGERK
jgi:glutaminyl-peptide cyclotransferase